MSLKLPFVGLLVYCLSLIAFTLDFLSEVTGWKLLSALPWVLHEIFTLMTLVVCRNVLHRTILSVSFK